MKVSVPSSLLGTSNKQKSIIFFTYLCLLSLLMAYLFYLPKSSIAITTLPKEGDIASEDLIISEDITVEDPVATDLEKQKVIQNTVPVYEYNREHLPQNETLLGEWYETIRKARKKNGLGEISRRLDLKKQLEEKFSVFLTDLQIGFLLRFPSFQNLDLNDLIKLYQSFAKNGIVPSKISAIRSPQNTLKIIGLSDKATIVSLDTILDLKEIKDALSSYLLAQSFKQEEATLLSKLIIEFINPNLQYSEKLTKELRLESLAQINPVLIKLKEGKVLVRKGDEYRKEDLRLISMITSSQPRKMLFLSPFFLVFYAVFLLLFFLKKNLTNWSGNQKNQAKAFPVFIATLLVSAIVYRLVSFLAPLVLQNLPVSMDYSKHSVPFILPFIFGALIIAITFSFSHAIAFSFLNAILGGIMSGWDLTLTLYILFGNLMASLGVEHLNRLKRSVTFKSALLWALPTQILTVLMITLQKSDYSLKLLITHAALATVSVLVGAILASFLIPSWETLFTLVTDMKLIELTNLNLPIFRQMLEKAPGTYHHSQMVASLSESAAIDLKLSPLQLTAMALYHDIGKINSPQYFVENHNVYASPHPELTPLESARAIIAHIDSGRELADKLKIPAQIASAISQHHGSKIVKFFYDKALELNTNGHKTDVDASDFKYPGKKPQNIENAIIMLADQVEAASKSLANPNENEISNIIEKIINANIDENQFSECSGLTFQALSQISASFHKKLSSIYHMRIAYPGFDFSKKEIEYARNFD